MDAIVTSVKPTGIFTLAGPLSVFIARKVGALIFSQEKIFAAHN